MLFSWHCVKHFTYIISFILTKAYSYQGNFPYLPRGNYVFHFVDEETRALISEILIKVTLLIGFETRSSDYRVCAFNHSI